MIKTKDGKSFSDIIGHKAQLEYLISNIETGDLAHAYLFIGEEGIGKKRVAFNFIESLMCEKDSLSCGKCDSCLKIKKNIHPDLLVISNEGVIKIDQVRTLISQANLKPFSAKYKVFLIDNADTMTTEASNALLKTLEEPSGRAVIILIAKDKTSLLPTIVSRSRVIKFFRASDAEVSERIKDLGFNGSDRDFVLSLLSGRAGFLAEYTKNSDKLKKSKQDLASLFNLIERDSRFESMQLAQEMASSYMKDQASVIETLDVWLIALRELLYNMYGIVNYHIFGDIRPQELNRRKLVYVIKYLNWLKSTLTNPRSGFNIKLLFDLMAINLGRLKNE